MTPNKKIEKEWLFDYYLLTIYPNEPRRKKEYKIPNDELLDIVIDDLPLHAKYEIRKIEKLCRISV